jgi:hypothetical protein
MLLEGQPRDPEQNPILGLPLCVSEGRRGELLSATDRTVAVSRFTGCSITDRKQLSPLCTTFLQMLIVYE